MFCNVAPILFLLENLCGWPSLLFQFSAGGWLDDQNILKENLDFPRVLLRIQFILDVSIKYTCRYSQLNTSQTLSKHLITSGIFKNSNYLVDQIRR